MKKQHPKAHTQTENLNHIAYQLVSRKREALFFFITSLQFGQNQLLYTLPPTHLQKKRKKKERHLSHFIKKNIKIILPKKYKRKKKTQHSLSYTADIQKLML